MASRKFSVGVQSALAVRKSGDYGCAKGVEIPLASPTELVPSHCRIEHGRPQSQRGGRLLPLAAGFCGAAGTRQRRVHEGRADNTAGAKPFIDTPEEWEQSNMIRCSAADLKPFMWSMVEKYMPVLYATHYRPPPGPAMQSVSIDRRAQWMGERHTCRGAPTGAYYTPLSPTPRQRSTRVPPWRAHEISRERARTVH